MSDAELFGKINELLEELAKREITPLHRMVISGMISYLAQLLK